MPFSFADRERVLQKVSLEKFDLIVIGGGITGAGIALDATARGLKTILLEKNDFAYGTSSRSTKLIHGGLRYLKQLEFGLVKEVGSERAVVHKLAPHLVVSEKMLLPLKEGRGFGSILTSFGLKLYDWLAGVRPEDQRVMLTRKRTLEREPLLKPDGIKGGGLYAEYRTDDARLTLEIIKTAQSRGAVVLNYAEVNGFMYDNGRLHGVIACDVFTKSTYTIDGKVIVNACGPWVDSLRLLDNSKHGKYLHLTKGVHIVVPYQRLPVKQAIYFDVPDGRMIFAIPRGRTTYIGTTDTDYKGSIDEVTTTPDDAEYLIYAVNDSFPSSQLTIHDVESSWAGLRPLIHEQGKSASELSRKDEVFESKSGLISIAGGKLTGYRKMAERVTDLVIERTFNDKILKPCSTASIALSGGPFKDANDVKHYIKSVAYELMSSGLQQYAPYLVHNYGRQCKLIIKKFEGLPDADTDIRLGKAEVWYGVHHEMVITALDFFVRRTGLLFFDMPRMKRLMVPLMQELATELRWSGERKQQEQEQLDKVIQMATLQL